MFHIIYTGICKRKPGSWPGELEGAQVLEAVVSMGGQEARTFTQFEAPVRKAEPQEEQPGSSNSTRGPQCGPGAGEAIGLERGSGRTVISVYDLHIKWEKIVKYFSTFKLTSFLFCIISLVVKWFVHFNSLTK